jgi:hypothetical protein
VTLTICSVGLDLEKQVPGSLKQSNLGKRYSASAKILCPGNTLSLCVLHVSIGGETYHIDTPSLAEQVIGVAGTYLIVGIVITPGLSFACQVTFVVESIKVPGVKLGTLEGDTTTGLVRILGVVLLKLCLDVIGLKHLAGLNVNVAMLLFTSFVVLGFMLDECKEADATSLEKLIEFKLQVSGGIKRYR